MYEMDAWRRGCLTLGESHSEGGSLGTGAVFMGQAAWRLKKGPVCCPKRSVIKHKPMPRNIPEEWRPILVDLETSISLMPVIRKSETIEDCISDIGLQYCNEVQSESALKR